MKKQQTTENTRIDRVRQLGDILARYELNLPFNAETLLVALEELDNPYDLILFLKEMELRIASEYGEQTAMHVMPEISAIHAQLSRPSLADLSYKQLEEILKNAQTIRKFPTKEISYCQAGPDMQAMLEYVGENTPALTKTLKQLNRKSVAVINDLFVEPQQTIHDYGKAVFIDRDEHNIWKLRFLRSLAQTCYMTYVRKGQLRLAKRGKEWITLDTPIKIRSLFRAWCEDADWSFWNDWDSEIADCLHFEQLMLYQVILALDIHYGQIEVSKLDRVCATLCRVDSEPDEYGMEPLRYKSYFLVLKPLIYLGLAIPVQKLSKDQYDLPKNVALTDYGKWQLNTAIHKEWSWVKARSICSDCQKIHRV